VRGFAKRSGIAATLEAPDELGRLPEEIETTLFRIIQEALTNIQRHSGSATARIFLNRQNGNVRLQVEDEGRGLPKELRSNVSALRAAGVGIAGIEQRVQEFGGQMEIESHDSGTKLRVTLPVEEV
jgi:signal transduction histidine kinase